MRVNKRHNYVPTKFKGNDDAIIIRSSEKSLLTKAMSNSMTSYV